jgi:hypothetical protein
MVEVFKTNIKKTGQSKVLIEELLRHYPESEVNIDLDDCDNVLRVEGNDICPHKIIELVTFNGYECEILP